MLTHGETEAWANMFREFIRYIIICLGPAIFTCGKDGVETRLLLCSIQMFDQENSVAIE